MYFTTNWVDHTHNSFFIHTQTKTIKLGHFFFWVGTGPLNLFISSNHFLLVNQSPLIVILESLPKQFIKIMLVNNNNNNTTMTKTTKDKKNF